MNMLNYQQSQNQASMMGPAGCWKLLPGRALSLYPMQDSVLLLVQGQAWLTLNMAPRGWGDGSGDHVLRAGQQTRVPAGRHLVLESLDAESVFFDWLPAPVTLQVSSSRWEESVLRPLRDLGLALWLSGGALRRLLHGLAGYGAWLVAGRGRVLSGHEANPP